MQAKTMVIIALVLMGALVLYNVAISRQDVAPVATETVTTANTNTNASTTTVSNTDAPKIDTDITDKPLGQQPKAILDKANNEIDKAQQLENDKMAQLEGQ